MFKIGDNVVCIKEERNLILHRIYTIKTILKTITSDENFTTITTLCLNECNNISDIYKIENFITLLDYRKQKINKIKEKICSK